MPINRLATSKFSQYARVVVFKVKFDAETYGSGDMKCIFLCRFIFKLYHKTMLDIALEEINQGDSQDSVVGEKRKRRIENSMIFFLFSYQKLNLTPTQFENTGLKSQSETSENIM
jgi:hypothetical protein